MAPNNAAADELDASSNSLAPLADFGIQTDAGAGAAEALGGAEGGGIGLGGDSDFSSMLEGIPMMASGGDVYPGHSYIVGEKHPELFMPRTAGQILPQAPASTGTSGNGRTVNQTVNFNYSQGTDLFKKSMSVMRGILSLVSRGRRPKIILTRHEYEETLVGAA